MAQLVTICEGCKDVTRYHGSHVVKMKVRVDIPGLSKSMSREEEYDARLCHVCYINAGYKERRKKKTGCFCVIEENGTISTPCKIHDDWKDAA